MENEKTPNPDSATLKKSSPIMNSILKTSVITVNVLKDIRKNLKVKPTTKYTIPSLKGVNSNPNNNQTNNVSNSGSNVDGNTRNAGLGAGLGIAAVGAGLAGFLIAMSGADSAVSALGNGSALKELMKNLAEGVGSFSGQSLVNIGALLATGAFVGAVGGVGRSVGAGMGMTAIGAGLAGFMISMSAADAAIESLGNGSSLKVLMGNLSEGLGSFSGQSAANIAVLLASGAFAGGIGGVGTAIGAGMGITLIGAGLAGFMSAMGAADWAIEKLGTGESLKTLMQNLAEGIGAFSGSSLASIGALLAAGALFGAAGGIPAGFAAIGITAIGLGLSGFLSALGVGDAVLRWLGEGNPGGSIKVMMINLAEGLKSFIALGEINLKSIYDNLPSLGTAFKLFLAEGLIDAFGSDNPGGTIKTLMINLAEGLKSLSEVRDFGGENFAKGLTAVGKVFIDLAKGNFIQSVGDVVKGLGQFFGIRGSDSPIDKIASLAEKSDSLLKVGDALQKIADSLEKFASIRFDSNIMARELDNLIKELSRTLPLIDSLWTGDVTKYKAALGRSQVRDYTFVPPEGGLRSMTFIDEMADRVSKIGQILNGARTTESNVGQLTRSMSEVNSMSTRENTAAGNLLRSDQNTPNPYGSLNPNIIVNSPVTNNNINAPTTSTRIQPITGNGSSTTMFESMMDSANPLSSYGPRR